MKLVGFIKEHDSLKGSVPFKEAFGEAGDDGDFRVKAAAYLENGYLVTGWMEYCEDLENGNLIAPHGYHTDGAWVWPSYFPYYIRKHDNFTINREFSNYIMMKNFEREHIDNSRLETIERELLKKLKDK